MISNNVSLVIIHLAIVFVFMFGLYLLGRVFIPILAEQDTFFSSPKLGRVKAICRSGRIIGFIDNLVGKGKYANKITGKIEVGEFIPRGFWWKFFGVYFIGLDQVYKYTVAIEAVEERNGEIKYVEKNASSIFLEGSYQLTAHFMTCDGICLKIRLHLKLTTLDAAKALSLPVSWTIPVFAMVLGASRDFFGTRSLKKIISTRNEGMNDENEESGIGHSEYIKEILSLNKPNIGNISLEEMCGQRIDAVNIMDIDFVDSEAKKAFFAPFLAEQNAQTQVKEAEAYASAIHIKSVADKLAAENMACSIMTKGNAEAGVYGKKRDNLGGDSKAAAQIIVAEQQSTMKNLTTLVNGGNSLVSIPTNSKQEKK